ncbi:hypothetical protein Esi_0495_0005 [Ectocarpus siliculosus]|uniref:Uncharacterized protein n=1 Tax=Ectocarpus siliculosus TaxID=2880 RepID=D7G341_ECTSI|nr:hypothetical protein Esi_0495_0005 [Ectocarpus siliculosus]|eukprot:CBJ33484.1 hypothetical protein Esi_0495_0005 [Ectocarpus siliculosus]
MMVLLAVLADGATTSISPAAAAAAAARTVGLGEDRRSAVVLNPCGPEAAACVQDADCRDCEARRMGEGGMGGEESTVRGDRRPRVIWDEFRINPSLLSGGAGSPSNKLCEKFGAVACARMTTALGAVGAEEGYATVSENQCRDNPVVKELFACRMASAGCELEDAPCVTQNPRRLQQREASSQSVDHEGYGHARPLPPGEAVVERGARRAARAAAPGVPRGEMTGKNAARAVLLLVAFCVRRPVGRRRASWWKGESAPSLTSSAGLRSSSTARWSPSPSTVPSAAPTAALSDSSRGDAVGFVVGSFSAEGVSDTLLDSLGVAGVVRQVVCGLGSCPHGEDSVDVEAEVTAIQGPASRMLAAVGAGAQHSQSQRHGQQEILSRVRRRAPQHRQLEAGAAAASSRDPTTFWSEQRQELGRRRRLGDITGVEFKLPTGEGTEGDDGEVLTESQLAAAFINNVADPAVLSSLATDLGVDVEDLGFSNLAFYQGQKFVFDKEFDVGSLEFSGSSTPGGDDVTLGYHTWLLAIGLVSIPAFIVVCIHSCIERERAQDESWTGKPIIMTVAGHSKAGAPAVFVQRMKKPGVVSGRHEYDGAANSGDSGGVWRAGWVTAKMTAAGGRHADRKVNPALALIDRDDMCLRSSSGSQGGFTFDNPMHGGGRGDRQLYGDVESPGYATSGVAADNPTYARASATRRAQGCGPRKENQELEDEGQWPGRRMRGISGSSLDLSEQRLPTVAEADYSSGEWESESDRHASIFSPITGSESAAGGRGWETNSDRTYGSGGGPDNRKAWGGVSATPAAQPSEPLPGKSPALSKEASSIQTAQLTQATANLGSHRTTDSGATFDSIFDEEPEIKQPGRAKRRGNRKTSGGAAGACREPQASVRGDDCTTSGKTGGARQLTAACPNASRMTASVLRVEGAASPAQSKEEDATALLREHGSNIWGSGDVEEATGWQMKDVQASRNRNGRSLVCLSRGEHDGGRDGGSGVGDGDGDGGDGHGGRGYGGNNNIGDHPDEPPLASTQGGPVKARKVVPVAVHRRVHSTGSSLYSSDYSNESLSPVSKQRRQSMTIARISSCSSLASQALHAPSVCSAYTDVGSRVFGSVAWNRTYLGGGGGGSWYGGSSIGSTSSLGEEGASFSGDGQLQR